MPKLEVLGFPHQVDLPIARFVFVNADSSDLEQVGHTLYSQQAAVQLLREMKNEASTRDLYGLSSAKEIARLETEIRQQAFDVGIPGPRSVHDDIMDRWQCRLIDTRRSGMRIQYFAFADKDEIRFNSGRCFLFFDLDQRCARVVLPSSNPSRDTSDPGQTRFVVYSLTMLWYVASIAAQHDIKGLRVQDFVLVHLKMVSDVLKKVGMPSLPMYHDNDVPNVISLSSLVQKDLRVEYARFRPPI